ncbi:hypothetical protein SAMN02744037_00830 [Tepidibacter formicigenes DSM 15518]|jgi:hypothetical protein|uniref:Uncharacterized protein n=2 Tax=Tepidibacter TaxID=214904 RepID=A0A1M6M4Y6_9FIRM|nr:hypothetical protein SAMN02744037_00830 [Tepidibacter formicigenes DSM 15518]
MFESKQLNHILKSLDYSISSLENDLIKYEDYFSNEEIMQILDQLNEYKNIHLKIEWLITNKELQQFLE